MKIGRWWRVLELEGEGESEEGRAEESWLVTTGTKEKKKRRFTPGTVALQEIHKFQKSNGFFIRKLPFVRWVREIAKEQWGNLWSQALVLLALQEVVEAYIYLRMPTCVQSMINVSPPCQRLFNWHKGSRGKQLSISQNKKNIYIDLNLIFWSKLFGCFIWCGKEPYLGWQW